MSEIEQLQIDRVWTTDGFIGVPTIARSEDRNKVIAESYITRESRQADVCHTIELFPSHVAERTTTRLRGKRSGQDSIMETITIVMLTVAVSIALFAAIGYLCRF